MNFLLFCSLYVLLELAIKSAMQPFGLSASHCLVILRTKHRLSNASTILLYTTGFYWLLNSSLLWNLQTTIFEVNIRIFEHKVKPFFEWI